ncbi:MAG: LemA family protein [Proteobacteria bacterium]|nr:LemA family protein [Pseudomonadota bacterium]
MSVARSLFHSSRLWLMALALIAPLVLGGCGVNDIPTYDEDAKAKWSQVLNNYQRRADLVPNLVETVRGYATQERETLTAVVEARAKATQTTLPPDILNNPEAFQKFQQNQQALSSALSRLMVVVERYPDLKSNQNFLALQAQLEGTENRIAVARRDYIQAVQRYNTELRTFPGSIWAMLIYRDAKVKENFTAQPGAEQAPRVDFTKKS